MGNGERGTRKKLTGAARRWAGADKPPALVRADAGVVAGMRIMGIAEEDIEAVLAQQAQDDEAAQQAQDFEIHDDNWDSWLFYMVVQTQWVYAAGGMCVERVGLNYVAVESAARMSGKPRKTWPGLLADLQVIELAVLEADAELAQAAEKRK